MQDYKFDQGVRGDSVSLRCMIPDNHLLVRIHESKELDFSFIYEITKKRYCANYGRPSIDPVLFFKMQIICYLYDIRSNRRLYKEIQLNVAYRLVLWVRFRG